MKLIKFSTLYVKFYDIMMRRFEIVSMKRKKCECSVHPHY